MFCLEFESQAHKKRVERAPHLGSMSLFNTEKNAVVIAAVKTESSSGVK
jgi:hypothetical protein